MTNPSESRRPDDLELGVGVRPGDIEYDRETKSQPSPVPVEDDTVDEQRRLAALDLLTRVKSDYASVDEFLVDAAKVEKYIDRGLDNA